MKANASSVTQQQLANFNDCICYVKIANLIREDNKGVPIMQVAISIKHSCRGMTSHCNLIPTGPSWSGCVL